MEKKLGLSAKILYLCLAVSTFNPFIYTTALQPVLVKLTLAAGAILIVARLIRYKGYMKMPCAILMALFCIHKNLRFKPQEMSTIWWGTGNGSSGQGSSFLRSTCAMWSEMYGSIGKNLILSHT